MSEQSGSEWADPALRHAKQLVHVHSHRDDAEMGNAMSGHALHTEHHTAALALAAEEAAAEASYQYLAGRLRRTSTRPTLNRRNPSRAVCEGEGRSFYDGLGFGRPLKTELAPL